MKSIKKKTLWIGLSFILSLILILLIWLETAQEPDQIKLESETVDELLSWYQLQKLDRYEIVDEGELWRGHFYYKDGVNRRSYWSAWDFMRSAFYGSEKMRTGFRFVREMPDLDYVETWTRKYGVAFNIYADEHLLIEHVFNVSGLREDDRLYSYEDLKFVTDYRVENNFEFKRFGKELIGEFSDIDAVSYEKSMITPSDKMMRVQSTAELEIDTIQEIKRLITDDLLMRETMAETPGADDRPSKIHLTLYAENEFYYGATYDVKEESWSDELIETMDFNGEEVPEYYRDF